MRRAIVYAVFILHGFISISQQTIQQDSPDELYFEAVRLFENQAYKASLAMLRTYDQEQAKKSFKTEAEYYMALNSLRLGEKKASNQLQQFTQNNSDHPLTIQAYLELGHYLFDKKDFVAALSYYRKLDPSLLDQASGLTLLFKMAYASMVIEDNKSAVSGYTQVMAMNDQYYLESAYYLGLIHSNAEAYADALEVLTAVDGQEGAYKDEISELIANIYFQTNQTDKLISYARAQMSSKATQLNRTLNRLLGETYFNQGNYTQAANYLQRHLDLSRNKMDADGYYKLGYAYYQTGNNTSAIENFKLAALDKSEIGQTSSFYLGKLYLKSNQYNYARSAFQNVTEESSLKEESTFLIGKVNYSADQHGEAIRSLQAFMDEYPESTWNTEASELLTKSYLNTSDYEQVIEHIENTDVKTRAIKEAYQKVCFQKAQQLYNDSRFDLAIGYFRKALVYQQNQEITAHAYYLLGESLMLTDQAADASSAFINCIKKNSSGAWGTLSQYSLGYLSYNEKNYPAAQTRFETFLKSAGSNHRFRPDAKLRLADCYFVQKSFDKAISAYTTLLDNELVGQDYVNYQLGICYSLTDQIEPSRQAFGRVVAYPGKSSYKDNALYQLAQSYIDALAFARGVDYLNQIIRGYPESSLVPFAYNERALCFFNLNQNEPALSDYEFVLNQYIEHEVASGALLGLQELSKRGVEVSDFEKYMEAFKAAHPDDNSLEVVAFEAAKTKYYNQNYAASIQEFQRFEQKYPNSSFGYDAQYFMADAYYRLNDWRNAAEYFQKLIENENTSYKSRALDRRGKSLLALNEFKSALANYHKLWKLSNNRKEAFIAREGLMNAHYQLKNYDSAIYYANQIAMSEWQPPGSEDAVWLIKGKSLYSKKQYTEAVDELVKVANGPISERSAEAKYLLAKVFYEQQAYKQSLEALFDLNRNYGSYAYWIGKSFLLIADNYIALDELLQAKATLNSIVENSPVAEIVAEAKKKLQLVEKAEHEVLLETDTISEDSVNSNME